MTTAAKRKIAVAITAFGLGLIVAVFLSREPMETLSADGLADARRRWQDSAVTGYDLRYTMNRSEYVVCVRDGIVTEVTVNGRPPMNRDPRPYTIEGLFDTLAQELDNLSNPAGPFAGMNRKVFLRVRFNKELGYVERYLRTGGPVGRAATIELTDFSAAGE